MSLENHIKRIVREHAELDREIDKMESSGNFDDGILVFKKKQRLHLRDEIQRLKHMDQNTSVRKQ